MILSFGHICIELNTSISNKELASSDIIFAQNSNMMIGGAAAIQAISAARSGAYLSLIGMIGNDLFGENILKTLRREGIKSNSIIKSDHQTGIINTIKNGNNKEISIIIEGANIDLSQAQITNNMLNDRVLLMLQNDVSASINLELLKRAKNKDVNTMMSIYHAYNIDLNLLEFIDILIIKEEIILNICNDIKAFAKEKNIHLVVLKNNSLSGVYAISKSGKYYEQNSLLNNELDSSILAFHSFCGTFASCIQAGHELSKSMKYGVHASLLTAKLITKNLYSCESNIYNILPYLCDILG